MGGQSQGPGAPAARTERLRGFAPEEGPLFPPPCFRPGKFSLGTGAAVEERWSWGVFTVQPVRLSSDSAAGLRITKQT